MYYFWLIIIIIFFIFEITFYILLSPFKVHQFILNFHFLLFCKSNQKWNFLSLRLTNDDWQAKVYPNYILYFYVFILISEIFFRDFFLYIQYIHTTYCDKCAWISMNMIVLLIKSSFELKKLPSTLIQSTSKIICQLSYIK